MSTKKLITASLIATLTLTHLNSCNTGMTEDNQQSLLDAYEAYKKIDEKDLQYLFGLLEARRLRPEILALYTEDARAAVRELSEYFSVPTEWMYRLFVYESGMNPRARNKKSNATGLIQFMPSTARNLGTSTKELYDMSVIQQLPYVKLYLERINPSKKFDSFQDLYLAVFYPHAMNKPGDYIFGSHVNDKKVGDIAKLNSCVDRNKDSKITKKEFCKYAHI